MIDKKRDTTTLKHRHKTNRQKETKRERHKDRQTGLQRQPQRQITDKRERHKQTNRYCKDRHKYRHKNRR